VVRGNLRRAGAMAVLLIVSEAVSARGAEAVPDAVATPTPPETVDLRPAFGKWGLETRVQGRRGTCSAFVVTEAIEYAVARRQGRTPRLSVEFLNWAANEVTRRAEDGGFFSDLWNGCARYGVCPEQDLPYADRFDPALRPSPTALTHAKELLDRGLRFHWIKAWDPHQGLTPEQLAAVKKTLRDGWPVCGGFLWPKREQWEDGVLQLCPREAVRDGHSVLLVGFRDDQTQPGGGVLHMLNTANGGSDGLLSYEYLRTYMNDAAWVGYHESGEQGTSSGAPHPRRRRAIAPPGLAPEIRIPSPGSRAGGAEIGPFLASVTRDE
jgi:hypothetical protein